MDRPWTATKEQVLEEVESTSTGLSENEAQKRLAQSGLNRLVKPREISFAGVFWEEVREPMILLLLFVAVVYSFWGGQARDAITIFIIIILLVFTEILTEYRQFRTIQNPLTHFHLK